MVFQLKLIIGTLFAIDVLEKIFKTINYEKRTDWNNYREHLPGD